MSFYRDVMCGDYMEMARNFKVNPEHCDNPEHYENYIWQDSILDHNQGMGVTHVFIDDENQKMAGYITLRGSSLIADSGESFKFGYPALEIAELAVDKSYEGMGLGIGMVMFAVAEAVSLNEANVGFQYVVLCADPKAVGFYENPKLGFKRVSSDKSIPREYRNQNCVPLMLKIKKY